MIHDTHGHLEMLAEWEKIEPENLQNWIEKELEGHQFFIQAGVDVENFQEVWEKFKNIEKIYFLIGSHPEIVDKNFDLQKYLQNQEEKLGEVLKNPEKYRVVGIGEIGLDYFYSKDLEILEKQRNLFESQIQLAIKHNLPVQLHIREAFEDCLKILQKYPQIHKKFMVHCFSGNTQNLEEILKLGGLVAYGGISTFKNAKEVQESIRVCPDESFVLETDLPFLSPQQQRGKTCLPKFITHTAQNLAEIREVGLEEIWDKSAQNSKKFFNLN